MRLPGRPSDVKVVFNDLLTKPMYPGIIQLQEWLGEGTNKRFVVGDHFKRGTALEVVSTFLNRPDNRKTLQLDCRISCLAWGQAAGATVDHPVLPIGLPLEESEPEAMEPRSISKQLGLEVHVERLDNHRRTQMLLGHLKLGLVLRQPQESIIFLQQTSDCRSHGG